MALSFEPGTEVYVPWARAQLRMLGARRVQLGLPRMTLTKSPADGVLVHLFSSRFGDDIRISGGRAPYYLSTLFDVCADPVSGDGVQVVLSDYRTVERTGTDTGYSVLTTARFARGWESVHGLVDTGTWLDASYSYTISTTVETTTEEIPEFPGAPAGTEAVQGGTITFEINSGGDYLPFTIPYLGTVEGYPSDGVALDGTEYGVYLPEPFDFIQWYAMDAAEAPIPFEVQINDAGYDISEVTDVVFTPDSNFYDMISYGSSPATPASTVTHTTTTVVETYVFVNWYDGSQIVDGDRTVTTVTYDADPPMVTDDDNRTYRTLDTALGTLSYTYPTYAENTSLLPTTSSVTVDYWAADGSFVVGEAVVSGTKSNTGGSPFEEVWSTYGTSIATGATWMADSGNAGSHGSSLPPHGTIGGWATAAGLDPTTRYVLVRTGTYQSAGWGGNPTENDGALPYWVALPNNTSDENEAQRCEDRRAARFTALLSSDDLARDTYFDLAVPTPLDVELTAHTVAKLEVSSYPIEYQTADGWTLHPGSDPVTRARVATGHREQVIPAPNTVDSRVADKFAGREVAVTTVPANLVYISTDASIDAEGSAQETAFQDAVVSAGGVDYMTDAEKVQSMFYEIPEQYQSVL